MAEYTAYPRAAACGAGWILACSRRGSSHSVSGAPCQDAAYTQAGFLSGSPFLIGAIADGHGDSRYDRSASGAFFAAKAAAEEIHAVLCARSSDAAIAAASRALRNDFPMRVRKRWRKFVEEDLAYDDGQSACGESEIVRYGTTLIVAAVLESHVYVTHLGDGDVVWVPDASKAEIVTPHPNRGVAGETDSMIDKDAHLRFRPKVLNCSQGGYLFLSSDGLSDAHVDDEQFLSFATDLAARFEEYGDRRVSEVLPRWLDDRSKRGSGDDISVVVIRVNGVVREKEDVEGRPLGESMNHSKNHGDETDAAEGATPTG